MSFIAKAFSLPLQPSDPLLAGGHIPASELALISSAQQLMQHTRQQAARRLRCQRQRSREQTRQQAAQATAHQALAERSLAQQAASLEQHYQQQQQQMRDSMHAALDVALQQIVQQLASELTTERKLHIITLVLAQTCPTSAGACLEVSPADLASARKLPGLTWPLVVNTQLADGSCRLVSSQGIWHCHFNQLLKQLLEAPQA